MPVVLVLTVAWIAWPRDAEVEAPAGAHSLAPTPAQAGAATASPLVDQAPTGANRAGAERIDVTTATAFVVRGRAVRGVDTPAPAAKVQARAFAGTAAIGEPIHTEELTADGHGNFAWELPAPIALTFLEFRGAGERIRSHPETFALAAGDPPPPPFDLWVVPLTAVIRGRVLDQDDQPIAGARVGNSAREGVRTAADGTFEVFVEQKPSVRLYASARGFVELREDVVVDVATAAGTCELRLRTANRIHGRVTDPEQRPVAGATVRTFYTIYTDGSETDADGRFVLDNLDPSLASHSVFARKQGYVEGKAEVQATGPDVEQNLVLGYGVGVRGVVVGPDGKPVPAATVFLGFSPSAYDRLDAVSAADGSFEFPCVAAGEQTVNVERTGFAGKRVKVSVPPTPSPPVVVRIELEPGHFVGGRAVTANGKPAMGVSIAPRLDGDYLDGIRAKADDDGRFRLDGLPSRGLDLEFYGKGFLRKNHQVTTVDRDDLVVTLERHGRMAGTVVDGRTGKPIVDFRIRFGTPRLDQGESSSGGYSAEWVRGGKAFHDQGGVFHIDEGVQVGSVFALEASADGYGAAVDDHVVATLDPDPTKTVITLHPGVAIDGIVRERATSVPIAGAKVVAFHRGRPLQPHEPNDEVGRAISVSDARGCFRLQNVGTGEVLLSVSHPDWLPTTHGPITIGPDALVPVQEIALDDGVTLQVLLRAADGSPMANADLELLGRRVASPRQRTDASGIARFDRLDAGEYEVALIETVGTRSGWTFRRQVKIGGEDHSLEFVAKDGDATLVVYVDSTEPLPDDLQILVQGGGEQRGDPGSFHARSACLQPDRTEIRLLPAGELLVMVMAGGWNGSATATTIAGQSVEVRVAMTKWERGRR
ncbi:MAG: carboxypeptidase-like regulatory domain-containing protein [Planctomycetota bacterium]